LSVIRDLEYLANAQGIRVRDLVGFDDLPDADTMFRGDMLELIARSDRIRPTAAKFVGLRGKLAQPTESEQNRGRLGR